jgi:hypothetical protein
VNASASAPALSIVAAFSLWLSGVCAYAQDAAESTREARDALLEMWPGEYDLTEEMLVAGEERDARIGALPQQRVQYVVRPAQIPWLGTHVLFAEEFPYDDPSNVRRRVLLVLEAATPNDGDVRVRQFTLKAGATHNANLSRDDVESLEGCDLWLIREGNQFRGGTRGVDCALRVARRGAMLTTR